MDVTTFEPTTIVVILGGFIGLLLILGAPIKPIRMVGSGFVRIMLGALGLFIINSIGTLMGLHIPINLITASISGFLGIPGMVALIAINQIVL
ncbi:MAG TPA: pro-sigmaK processing inhibitor BofA [Bacillus bacterium]|nr:pro-sigmaK processing inhibitor BofA [Bacillus sp. (in: firmicutes)]